MSAAFIYRYIKYKAFNYKCVQKMFWLILLDLIKISLLALFYWIVNAMDFI